MTTPSKIRTALDLASSALDLAKGVAGMFKRRTPKEKADRLRARALRKRMAAARALSHGRRQRLTTAADLLEQRADKLDPPTLPGA